MALRYWVGGSGTWTDTAHWSLTSGGISGASSPTASDDVVFDANSTTAAFTVSVDVSIAPMLSIDSSALISTKRLTTVTDPSVTLGYLSPKGDVSIAYTNLHQLFVSGAFTTNLRMIGAIPTGGGTSSIGTMQISSAATVNLLADFFINNLSLSYGTLTTNNFNGYAAFSANGSSPSVLNLGSSVWDTPQWTTSNSSLTLNPGTSQINAYQGTFNGGGKTFATVRLEWRGGPSTTVVGSNTIGTLKIDPKKSAIFTAGTTQTIGSLTAVGTSSTQITLRSSVAGTRFNLSSPTGVMDGSFLDLKDSNGIGGATFTAHNSVDSGNNAGWAFIGPTVPVSDFTASATSGRAPLSVNFTDLSTGIPDTWAWTFGDGSTSTLQSPTHVYSTPGTYSVSLFASNSLGGSTATKTSYITATATVISPTSFGPDEAFDSPSVLPGNTNRPTDSILPDEGFSDVYISLTAPLGSIASDEAFANPTMITGVTNIFPTEISSDEVISTDLIVSRGLVYISPSSAGPDETFDNPTIAPGPVTVSGIGEITTLEAFDPPTIILGAAPLPPATDWAAIGKEDDKDYIYRVYQPDGTTFIGIWNDVGDELQFTQPINTPGTTTTVKLNRSPNTTKEVRAQLVTQAGERLTTEDLFGFAVTYQTNNSVGAGTDVDIDLRVDIEVQYGNFDRLATQNGDQLTTELSEYLLAGTGAPSGVRVFSGYILDYESLYGDSNGVTVTLASNGGEMAQQMILNGLNTTTTVATQEIATTIKGILDTNPGRIGYTVDSIASTGVTAPATFRLNTKLEGVESMVTQAPAGYYWYVNVAENRFYLQQASTVADHTFLLGYHIKNMALKRSQEQLRNQVYFVGAEVSGVSILKKYDDATSQAAWGVGLYRITDRRYSVTASIDRRVAKEMSLYKNPIYTTTVEISSARYNLESIKLGQMVSVGNTTDDTLRGLLLQIVSLSYSPTKVTMQLGAMLDSQADVIDDVESNLQNEQYQTLPNAPS